MLPEFYRTCLKSQLSESQLHTLEILVWLLQFHAPSRCVTRPDVKSGRQARARIERLAACLPLLILFESRRRHLKRFLILLQLSVALLWLPIIKCILRTQIKPESQVIVTLDRTRWAENNLLMVSVVWERRAWPVYWQFMEKKGNSNLAQQKAVLCPVFRLLKRYQIVVVGSLEFHSVKLASWLESRQVNFAIRQHGQGSAAILCAPEHQRVRELHSTSIRQQLPEACRRWKQLKFARAKQLK